MTDDPMRMPAVALADALRAGEVSAREAVEASLRAIDSLDGQLHAFLSVDPELALTEADQRDRVRDRHRRGPLHGVPVAVKDVTDVQGFPTTHGSLTGRPEPVAADELSVARLRQAGAVVVGKTNTPEFGFGAVCTNKLAGATRNPWNHELTSGGSSGGSAVAVTAGMLPLAQGADFGGSVRTPASFCGCVGLRPTPGSIPEPARPLAWNGLATQGILARNVADAELMLGVMTDPDPRDPTSRRRPVPRSERPLRVAASVDLGGAYRVDPAVRSAFAAAVDEANAAFGTVVEAAPVLDGAVEAFQVLRAAQTWAGFRELVDEHEVDLTASFIWNVRQGRDITAERYLRAERLRSRAYRSFQHFFRDVDILLLPAASVLPFPVEQGEVTHIDGVEVTSIIDYLACTFLISLVGFPALSVPAWTAGGLPFGLQLVARPDEEATLLDAARVLESSTGFGHRWPA